MRHRGLACKLSMLIVAGGVVVWALVFGYNYQVVRQTIIRNAGENARNLTVTTVNRVEAVLRSAQKVPRNLADVLEHSAYTEGDLLRLLRAAVENNREVYGAAVAFEPYAVDAQALYFAPYFHKRGDAVEFSRLGGDAYRYFFFDWYQIPKETGRAAWSEPYFDDGGGGILMSTYSVPFYSTNDGHRRFMGVVTVDISLDWLRALVSSMRILQTGYAFLISKNGVLVTHPRRDLVLNETIFSLAEARDDDALRMIGREMIRGGSGFAPTHCMGSDAACWLAYAPLPATGWSLGAMFPEHELLEDVTRLNRTVVVLAVLGSACLLLIVVWAARSITRPLTELTRAAAELAQGNLDGALPEVTTGDEVGRLSTAFARMQRDLRRYIADLKETSAAKERAAAELAEYSRTLEDKVAERTRALCAKNADLEATLARLKATQEQLVVQEKLAALGALTAGIAHEIKNPLNFVKNFAELSVDLVAELRAELRAERARGASSDWQSVEQMLGDLEQNVTKINEHGKRADGIVRGMLQHSRGGASEPQAADLNELLAEYVALAYHGRRGQDASFNVTLETQYDPAVGTLNVVAPDLGRVFLNIMNNACYAAFQKRLDLGADFTPTVGVRTQNFSDRVEIRIRDNGNGIPPALRDKIFEPFFTTKPAGQGTGLGLSISYDIIVRQHHGELRVESAEGRYAEFVIVLPKEVVRLAQAS